MRSRRVDNAARGRAGRLERDALDDSIGVTPREVHRARVCDNQRECVTLSFSGKRTTSRLDGGTRDGRDARRRAARRGRSFVVET